MNRRDEPGGHVSQGRLPGLEALRFIAAASVLLLHARAVYGGRYVFGRGYLGVDFFLMLAGYLMARVQEPRLAGGMSPWRFLAGRYARLWPTLALAGLVGLPMQWLRGNGQFVDFGLVSALNLALLPAFWSYFAFPLNIPAWTIFAQILCEGAQASLLWRARRLGLALALIASGGVTLWAARHYGSLDLGAKSATLLPGLARCLFAWLLGVALSRWWGDRAPLPVPPWLALPLMPALLPLGWWLRVRGWWIDPAFVLIACPIMLAGALRLRRFGWAAAWLGRLSFPLFAFQMPILQGLKQLGFGYWTGLACAFGGGILATFVTSALGAWPKARKQEAPT